MRLECGGEIYPPAAVCTLEGAAGADGEAVSTCRGSGEVSKGGAFDHSECLGSSPNAIPITYELCCVVSKHVCFAVLEYLH